MDGYHALHDQPHKWDLIYLSVSACSASAALNLSSSDNAPEGTKDALAPSGT